MPRKAKADEPLFPKEKPEKDVLALAQAIFTDTQLAAVHPGVYFAVKDAVYELLRALGKARIIKKLDEAGQVM